MKLLVILCMILMISNSTIFCLFSPKMDFNSETEKDSYRKKTKPSFFKKAVKLKDKFTHMNFFSNTKEKITDGYSIYDNINLEQMESHPSSPLLSKSQILPDYTRPNHYYKGNTPVKYNILNKNANNSIDNNYNSDFLPQKQATSNHTNESSESHLKTRTSKPSNSLLIDTLLPKESILQYKNNYVNSNINPAAPKLSTKVTPQELTSKSKNQVEDSHTKPSSSKPKKVSINLPQKESTSKRVKKSTASASKPFTNSPLIKATPQQGPNIRYRNKLVEPNTKQPASKPLYSQLVDCTSQQELTSKYYKNESVKSDPKLTSNPEKSVFIDSNLQEHTTFEPTNSQLLGSTPRRESDFSKNNNKLSDLNLKSRISIPAKPLFTDSTYQKGSTSKPTKYPLTQSPRQPKSTKLSESQFETLRRQVTNNFTLDNTNQKESFSFDPLHLFNKPDADTFCITSRQHQINNKINANERKQQLSINKGSVSKREENPPNVPGNFERIESPKLKSVPVGILETKNSEIFGNLDISGSNQRNEFQEIFGTAKKIIDENGVTNITEVDFTNAPKVTNIYATSSGETSSISELADNSLAFTRPLSFGRISPSHQHRCPNCQGDISIGDNKPQNIPQIEEKITADSTKSSVIDKEKTPDAKDENENKDVSNALKYLLLSRVIEAMKNNQNMNESHSIRNPEVEAISSSASNDSEVHIESARGKKKISNINKYLLVNRVMKVIQDREKESKQKDNQSNKKALNKARRKYYMNRYGYKYRKRKNKHSSSSSSSSSEENEGENQPNSNNANHDTEQQSLNTNNTQEKKKKDSKMKKLILTVLKNNPKFNNTLSKMKHSEAARNIKKVKKNVAKKLKDAKNSHFIKKLTPVFLLAILPELTAGSISNLIGSILAKSLGFS